MAKIVKRNLDSARRAPVRKKSYEAPALKGKKKSVPKEYQTLKKAPRHHNGFLWLLFLAFLAAVAGFFYWSQQNTRVADNSMEMVVVGPEKTISGDQVSYNIEYKNIDTVDLQEMELSVRWPAGFYFDESSIEASDEGATSWKLPDLAPGQTANLEIKGVLVGHKDDQLSATFSLHYQPANFHSDFKVKQTVETEISENKLSLEIQGLDKTLVSTDQEFQLVLKNLSNESLEGLSMDILYPDDWLPVEPEEESDEEEPTEDNASTEELISEFVSNGKYWDFSLEPEEEKVMSIFGTFPTDSKTEQSLVIEVGNLVNDSFRRLARAEKNFMVVNPEFDVSLKINGEEGDQNVKWDDSLRYQLEITNDSETEITDVKVVAFVEGDAIDWDTLDTIGSNTEESNIVWTQEEDEALAIWPVGETRLFTWEVSVVDEPVAYRLIENIVKLNIEGLSDWEQVTSPVMLTVGESLSFNDGVYWHLGGRQVGSGYLPPQVGEETQYLAVWSITQATGYFDTVSAEAVLPPKVSFVEETDVTDGELSFDEETRVLSWTVDNFDDLILPSTASFIISLEPTEEDQGQTMSLINSATLKAVGLEEVIVETKIIKTSDVVANTSEPIGIVE